jgi:hypothetical protein
MLRRGFLRFESFSEKLITNIRLFIKHTYILGIMVSRHKKTANFRSGFDLNFVRVK